MDFFHFMMTSITHAELSPELCDFVADTIPRFLLLGCSEVQSAVEHLRLLASAERAKHAPTMAALPVPVRVAKPCAYIVALAVFLLLSAPAAVNLIPDGLPGVFEATGLPRHDNDFENIRHIESVPTQAEVLCPHAPYLPFNSAASTHHLGEVSWLRHIDTQFRLLRHDMIASLCEAITAFLSGRYQDWVAKPSGQRFSANFGDRRVDVFVYTGAGTTSAYQAGLSLNGIAAIASIVRDKLLPHGVAFALRFRQLPTVEKMSRQLAIEHWAKSKRLMQGSLVCLVMWRTNSPPHVVFASIVKREKDLLGDPKGHAGSPNQLNFVALTISVELYVMPISRSDAQSCMSFMGDTSYNVCTPEYIRLSTVVSVCCCTRRAVTMRRMCRSSMHSRHWLIKGRPMHSVPILYPVAMPTVRGLLHATAN